MLIQEISTSRKGAIIIDNNQMYFEPGEHDDWYYPSTVTIQEIEFWYKLIASFSGIELKINFKDYRLV